MELACCLVNASARKRHRKLILTSVGMNHLHSSKLAASKLENVEMVCLDYFWSIISAALLQRVSYHPIGIFRGRVSPFLEESQKKSYKESLSLVQGLEDRLILKVKPAEKCRYERKKGEHQFNTMLEEEELGINIYSEGKIG